MIAGLEFPTEGSLTIFGQEVGTLPPNKRPVNTVFQNYALFPHLDVNDNVGFGLKMQKVTKQEIASRVDEALAMVRLGTHGQAPADAAVGRPAAARRAGPCARQPAEGAAARRAARRARPEAAPGDAERAQEPAARARHHVRVRHPRPGRGAHDERPHRRHGRGHLLQVDPPEAIYERPANRFVADFIGQTNLLEGTVEDPTTVCLPNGARIPLESGLAAGTQVAVILRPERATIAPRDEATAGRSSVDGVIRSITYLGNAIVYRVGLDWMELDVREENRPDSHRLDVGDDVTVSWDDRAVAVVSE